MKTYIIQLDQHDDIISARDKMRWGKDGRILLVWPESGRVLNRQLDLVLLQRFSKSMGSPLAIISRDPEVHYHAPRLGIPVFKSLKKAQGIAWRVPRRYRKAQEHAENGFLTNYSREDSSEINLGQILPERPARSGNLHPIIRLVAFTLGVMAFLSIAAVLLPSAEITLSSESITQESQITVLANPENEQVEISGNIPAYWKSVTVEGRDQLPVSGSIRVPSRAAQGHVKFTNLTDQPIMIPVGTIVRSIDPEAVRFEVTEAGEVDAGADESITLPVRCLKPGLQGNLQANSLIAIEGLLGTQLSATNPTATKSGADRVEPAPSEADREQLFINLYDSLEKTALDELKYSLQEGDLLYPDSLSLSEILEENYQPAEEQPADHLELNLRLEFQAMYVAAQDLENLASSVLDSNIPTGYIPIDNSLKLIHLTQLVIDKQGNISWQLQTLRQLQAQLKTPQAIHLVLGQTPEAAQSQLVRYMPIETSPQITISPFWWPRLPILPFRIIIHDQDQNASVQPAGAVSEHP